MRREPGGNGAGEEASPVSGLVRKVIKMLAGSSHASVLFGGGGRSGMTGGLNQAAFRGQICFFFFHKYSWAPRVWVFRTTNKHHSYMLRQRATYLWQTVTQCDLCPGPCSELCFMSLQKLPAMCGEGRKEGTAQMLCLEFWGPDRENF